MTTPEDCPMINSPLAKEGQWHLKKEVQLGHLLTSAVMLGSALIFVAGIERRLSILESQQLTAVSAQRERDSQQDRQASEAVSLVRTDIQSLSLKIDRLFERGSVK